MIDLINYFVNHFGMPAGDSFDVLVGLIRSQPLVAFIVASALSTYLLFYVIFALTKMPAQAADVVTTVINNKRPLQILANIIIAVLVLVAGIAAGGWFIDYVRKAALPTPSIPPVDLSIGDNSVLKWSIPSTATDDDNRFEVQWSPDPGFPSTTTHTRIVDDNVIPLIANLNMTLFWRARTRILSDTPEHPDRVGLWSSPVRIDHYESIWERIRHTGTFLVGMEHSYGTPFRFYAPLELKSGATKLVRAGVEVEVARQVANEICHELFVEPDNDGARPATSDSARPIKCIDSTQSIARAQKTDACKDVDCKQIKLVLRSTNWLDLLNNTGRGGFDAALSTITYLPAREKKYNLLFSKLAYHAVGYGFIFKADNKDLVSAHGNAPRRDLMSGMRIGVQKGTTSHGCLTWAKEHPAAGFPKFELHDGADVAILFRSLLSNRGPIDVIVSDTPYVDRWHNRFPDETRHFTAPHEFFGQGAPTQCNQQEYRVALKAGETRLQKIVDRVLKRLTTSGDLARIKTQATKKLKQAQTWK